MACSRIFGQETIQVKATGVGVTFEQAEKAALVNAVQQAVGLFLDSETLVKDEQVIYDKILSVSDGFISKMEVVVAPRKRPGDGLFETTINATVEKDKVGSELRKERILVSKTDGQNAWAEAATRIKDAQDGVAMLEKHLPEMQTRLLSARLVNSKDAASAGTVQPEVRPDPSTGMAICAWNIEVSYDREAYYQQALPLLQKCFAALAERREDDFVLHCVLAPPNQSEPVKSAFVNTPWRLYGNGAGQPEGWDEPSEFKVALNVGSDRSRQQLRFALYAFSREPYAKWLAALQEPLVLRIALVDSDGTTVHEDTVGLAQTLRLPTSNERRSGYAKPATSIPVDAVPVNMIAPRLGFTGVSWFRGAYLWFTPDFEAFDWVAGYYGLVDNLVLHYEASLDPEDLKSIKTVQFSFAPQNKQN
jgi:hypothetical protein